MTTATSEMNRKLQDFDGFIAINNKKKTGSNLFLTSTHFASNKVIYGHWVLFRTRNQPTLSVAFTQSMKFLKELIHLEEAI
jgi:hypothetical protein